MIIDHNTLTLSAQQFRDAMIRAGIPTPPDTIITDGEFHRFSTNGRKDGNAGWYVFNEDIIPYGAFGDDRANIKIGNWKADTGQSLTPAEHQSYQQKQVTLRQEKEAKKLRSQSLARERASDIIDLAHPAHDTHPYLLKKSIKAHRLAQWSDPLVSIVYDKETGDPRLQLMSRDGGLQFRFKAELGDKTPEAYCEAWKDILIIPMLDEDGDVQSLQLISKNGDKKFLAGGKMQGCYFPLGSLGGASTIFIAEGYATAATIYETTGVPVVVAYNAGNLKAVSESIRNQHPDAAIYICADDDYKTKGNPGILKAAEAAEAVSGGVIIPAFGQNRPEKATDFNDMAAHLGKQAVSQFFTECFSGTNKNSIPPAVPEPSEEPEGEAIFACPKTNPSDNPVLEPKKHFSDEEFEVIHQIWRIVPRQVTRHSADSYDLIFDAKRKVTVSKHRIDLARNPRHRPDAAYKAACEHARLFWNGEMEIFGDSAHRVKAFAYATSYGIKITNYKPSDYEMIEIEKILKGLRKDIEPMFRRPQAAAAQHAMPSLV